VEIEERLYALKAEFDEPITNELIDEIDIISQELGALSPVDLLRQFTI
jgi:hypothetical protein